MRVPEAGRVPPKTAGAVPAVGTPLWKYLWNRLLQRLNPAMVGGERGCMGAAGFEPATSRV